VVNALTTVKCLVMNALTVDTCLNQ